MISQTKLLIYRLLPKRSFARGVAVLVGGTAGAQLLLVLAAPILTRLYSPEDFGLLAVYASLLSLIAGIASLRYEFAIPLPEDDQEAANVTVLCLILVVVSSLLTGTLVAFLGKPISHTLGVPLLADYLWLLSVGVLLRGVYNVFNYWGIRTNRFTTIAATKLRQAVATLAIQLTAFKLGGLALLIGQIAGQGVGTISLAMPSLAKPEFKKISRAGIFYIIKRYKRFPLFTTWAGFSNAAGIALPPILFASLFNPVAAGLYALAHRVLSLPMSLIGTAIGEVFFAKAAEARRNGRIKFLVVELHKKLAHIGMAPILILTLLGPDLFAAIFGENWRQAGEFARWMAPWLYLVFVSSPLSTLFSIMEQQLQGLVFQIILLTSRIGAIVAGAVVTGDLMFTVKLFSIASALCWLGFLFWVANMAGNPLHSMIAPTLSALGISLLITAPIFFILLIESTFSYAWLISLVISILLMVIRYLQLLQKSNL